MAKQIEGVYEAVLECAKKEFLQKGCAEYAKRLSSFCDLRIIELQEELIREKAAGEALIARALEKEGEKIFAAVPKGAALVALCIEGKQISSEELAGLRPRRSRICDRLFPWARAGGQAAGAAAALDEPDDLSTPAGAADAARADLPRSLDQRGNQISQIDGGIRDGAKMQSAVQPAAQPAAETRTTGAAQRAGRGTRL